MIPFVMPCVLLAKEKALKNVFVEDLPRKLNAKFNLGVARKFAEKSILVESAFARKNVTKANVAIVLMDLKGAAIVESKCLL